MGGCVERGEGSSFRAKAHAHNATNKFRQGWICVRSLRRVGEWTPCIDPSWDGEIRAPSRLLWHEYAHLCTPNHGHDDVWRAKMREFHQPLTKQYRKRPRRGWGKP